MKMIDIEIRDVCIEDVATIKEAINEVWDFASILGSKAVLDATLSFYFNQVMYRSTYGRVAIMNGEVLGVIFGYIKGEAPQYRHLLQDISEITMTLMMATDEERNGLYEYFSKQTAVYGELIDGLESDYDGSLEFIVLSRVAQGKGVGRLLWENLKTHFEGCGITKIYVYTDTDCNYGFYDHLGFSCRRSKEVVYDFEGVEYTPKNFMYEMTLKK